MATLIVYTNYILRNDDGSTRQESERHRVIVWGLHAEQAAQQLRKGSKVWEQGRMTELTWKDKQTGATRYGAEIVAQTPDYQGANDEDADGNLQPRTPEGRVTVAILRMNDPERVLERQLLLQIGWY